jgi:membrane-associated protease RseP (regulator of RpoE activity)
MKEQKTLLIHIALFIITVITTTIAGAEWMYGRWLFIGEYSLTQEELWNGLSFSIPFLLILTVHEMGHYVVARMNQIKVTLPYYIPMWLGFIPGMPSFGTMGAFIRIKAVIQSRREYFDVGVAGPIAGFVMALLVLWYGFSHLPTAEYIFEIHPEYEVHGLDYADYVYEAEGMAFQLGENPIFWFFKTYVADPDLLPHPNEMIHYPFILAGYLALFFTALNLLPIGQLDGGHVIFGLFGSKIAQRINQVFYTLFLFYAGLGWISPDLLADVSLESVFTFVAYVGIYLYFVYLAVASMIPETRDRWFFAVVLLALQYAVTSFTAIVGYDGWLLFVFLIGRFLGVYHPKAVDDTPLDEKRNIIGWVAILIFLLCFSPQPFSLG